MNLRQLRHFVSAVEYRSINQAAVFEHVTQPTLTRSIHNLESRLGITLLERGPRGVTPTRYGQLLVERARLIINESRNVLEELEAMRIGRTGHVRLGIATSTAGDSVGSALAALLAERPSLKLTLDVGFPEQHFSRLKSGELDATITGRPASDDLGADLIFESLISFDLVILASAQHPLAKQTKMLSKDQLVSCNWAVQNQPGATEFYNAMLRTKPKTRDPLRVQCNSSAMIRSLLLHGDFVTLLAPSTVEEDIRTGRLVVLKTDLLPIKVDLCTVMRAGTVPTAALRTCLDRLKLALGNGTARRPRKLKPSG